MNVMINGQPRELAGDELTVSALLETLAVKGRRIAVEINEEIVPRSRHAEHPVREGDRIEVVGAIGGG